MDAIVSGALRTRAKHGAGEYQNNFMIDDAFYALSEVGINASIYEIINLFVKPEERANGVGRVLVEWVIKEHPSDIILVAAGASKIEFPKEPSMEAIAPVLRGLDVFFYKCGFASVNIVIGRYESKHAYLYTGSAIGALFYDKLAIKHPEIMRSGDSLARVGKPKTDRDPEAGYTYLIESAIQLRIKLLEAQPWTMSLPGICVRLRSTA